MGGGYAKIDKNKIQPSPALAALTGFLAGLNAKKKELQAREDAQNKEHAEFGKWMKEFGLKERETVVKEQGALTDQQKVQADIAMNQTKLDQANQQITNDINNFQLKYKDSLQKAYEYENEPFRKKQLGDIQLALDKALADYKGIIDAKTEEQKAKILQPYKTELEQMQQTGAMARVEATQQAETARTKMQIGATATQGELNRANAMKIAELRTSGDKDPNTTSYINAYDDYMKEMAVTISQYTDKKTGKVKEIPDYELQRLDSLYSNVGRQYNAMLSDPRYADVMDQLPIPSELQKVETLSPRWYNKKRTETGYQVVSPTKALPTLTPAERSDISRLTTPDKIKQAKTYYGTDEQRAYDDLIKQGFSNTVALKVLDQIFHAGGK